MLYQEFYQLVLWGFVGSLLLATLLALYLTRKLVWPIRAALIGSALIAVLFPAQADSITAYAPAFIQFGFALVDSGFDVAETLVLIQPMLFWLLLFNVACAVAYVVRLLKPSQAQPSSETKQTKGSKPLPRKSPAASASRQARIEPRA